MVFNAVMTDRTLIESLGGPARVAEMLGYDKQGGTQRVCNWLTRGIPAAVKLERPELFLPHLVAKSQQQPAHEPG